MYLKQLHTLIQYHNQGKLEQETEENADSKGIEAVSYLIGQHTQKIDQYLEMDINKNSKMRRDALMSHRKELEKFHMSEKMDV
jgi:hypothetical protein